MRIVIKKIWKKAVAVALTGIFTGNSMFFGMGSNYAAAGELIDNQIFPEDSTDVNGFPLYDSDFTAPVNFISAVSTEKGILLSWQPYEGALMYEIYRAQATDGEYQWIGDSETLAEEEQESFLDEHVTLGMTYYYKIRAYRDTENWEMTSYSEFSEVKEVQFVLSQTTILSAEAVDHETIRMKWVFDEKVSGYEIYRSVLPDDGYVLVQTRNASELTIGEETLDGANEAEDGWFWAYEYDSENNMYIRLDESQIRQTTTCEDQGLEIGQTYYYKIRGFADTEMGRIYSDLSEAVSVVPVPGASQVKKIKLLKPDKVLLRWKKVEKADGYYIYRAKGADGKFKKIKTIKNGSKLSLKVSGLKHGITYYYKIQAYYDSGAGLLNGVFSEAGERTMDYYGYETESWESRKQRIFGKKNYGYSSEAQARKNMRTIKIKVWDISGGKKITVTKSLTMHKNITETVQKIFKEIYQGKEKFPIHDIGGYSWRGNSSTSEHCEGLAMDINPNENYMIDGGRILSGSFWKPGKNPYSIPTDGEVARIMRKYGFFQGIWGDRRDYMHFSYFGT